MQISGKLTLFYVLLWINHGTHDINHANICHGQYYRSAVYISYILLVKEEHTLWTSGTKCLYCVSNLSNLGLKLLKKISILSQTCLGQNGSIWSQFETFLTFETQLRLPPFESNLRAIWDIILRCQNGVKKVSKMSQKGIWGDLVDGRSFQVPSLYNQTLWFRNYNFMVYSTIASYYLLVIFNQLYCKNKFTFLTYISMKTKALRGLLRI